MAAEIVPLETVGRGGRSGGCKPWIGGGAATETSDEDAKRTA